MAIVLFSLSIILFISLFSFDPNDPGFSTTGSKEINNFICLIGAYFSSASFVFFGVASYFIPLLFISFAVLVIQDKETISQPSFLKTEIIDGEITFEFTVDVDPVKLDGRRTEIAQDFVKKIDKEIETSIRKGIKNKGS